MTGLEGDYQRDGFAVARRVVGPETVMAMAGHLARLMASQPGSHDSNLVSGTVVDDPVWMRLVAEEALLNLAAEVLGDDLALFSSNYVVKPPLAGKAVDWHQDGGAWPLDPVAVVSLWIAVDDATQENGGLRVIPGSHSGGFRPHHHDPGRLATTVFPVAVEVTAEEERRAVAVDLRPGDVSAHHPAVIHGSGANVSGSRRAALVVRYMPTSTRVTVDMWPSRVVLRGS